MSAQALHNLLDCCNEVIQNLKTLGLNTDSLSEVMLVHFLQNRIGENLRREWELTLEDQELPSYDKFISFLEKHARSISSLKNEPHFSAKSHPKKSYTYNSVTDKLEFKEKMQKCILCKEVHGLHKCQQFLNMNSKERWEVVRNHKMCFNCLRSNHGVSECKITINCKKCSRRHHTLLHAAQVNPKDSISQVKTAQDTPDESTEGNSRNLLSLSNINSTSNILLATALIKIKDGSGSWKECRALLDGASQMSIITKDCCQNLKLPTKSTNHIVRGCGNQIAERATALANVEFTPHFNDEAFNVTALVVKNLTTNLPNFQIQNPKFSHIEGLQLADPNFYISRPVDIILGADIFLDLIEGEKKKGKHNTPSSMKTKLGWILSGKVNSEQNCDRIHDSLSYHTTLNLENLIQKFWEVESLPQANGLSDDDKQCELFYRENTKRDESGRHTVRLPLKKGKIGESRTQAVRQFLSLEKRLQANSILKDQYVSFMKEYLHLNHMKPLSIEGESTSSVYYLPHHGILRENSSTTKLRVVFNASAKSSSGTSLNDILCTGPKLQQDLFGILLRFRTYKFALTADVEKMYRQINVDSRDTDLQRIVWRESPEEPLQDFKLTTVTYGTSCAPYLAIRTLQQLAEDEKLNFPLASQITLRDFFVDDLITGTNSKQDAKIVINDMISLMRKGCFNLRKWISNEPSLIEDLPKELKNPSEIVKFSENQVVRVLGVIWSPNEDIFQISIGSPSGETSKRQILSTIAKIYDPLGLLSPSTITLKILMQDMWKEKVAWDDPVPAPILKDWKKTINEMTNLPNIKINRYIFQDSPKNIQMHGFCDASKRAYAAAIYIRSESEEGKFSVNLLAAKTRVAPLKAISLPKLELCGALLLSQLYKTVSESLNIKIQKTFFWTDSQIVLHWIQSPSYKWKTFVANRIAQIQELTEMTSWRHVSSSENPTDCASRGISASKLMDNLLWWHGPPFLIRDNFEEINSLQFDENDIEEEKEPQILVHATRTHSEEDFISRYSSYNKLLRITSWCLRFINNSRVSPNNRTKGPIKSPELKYSLSCLLKIIQNSEFSKEIYCLQNGKPLPKSSKLLPLNCFLDPDGIVRVGGRLKHSELPEAMKHQFILPTKHHFTDLVIDYHHKHSLHGGSQLVHSLIRQTFWIISGKGIVRRYLRKCLICYRMRTKTANQMMADFPKERITAARPFEKVSIDFSRPISKFAPLPFQI